MQSPLTPSECSSNSSSSSQPSSQPSEKLHFEKVCLSYAQYSLFLNNSRKTSARRIANLSPSQRSQLPFACIPGNAEFDVRERMFKDCVEINQVFIDELLQSINQPTSHDVLNEIEECKRKKLKYSKYASDDDISKVTSTLKSIARDWSDSGSSERSECYPLLLDLTKKYVRTKGKTVLVPGAGLGRLAAELIRMDYNVEGNDFAMHMLLASDFMLNHTKEAEQFRICPYIAATTNVFKFEDCCRVVLVPDVLPCEMMVVYDPPSSTNGDAKAQAELMPSETQPSFSFCAGDFLQIYSQSKYHETYSALVSCFFLDTAVYVGDYIESIYNLLEFGGSWICVGPMLWHWSMGINGGCRPEADEDDEDDFGKYSSLDERYFKSVDLAWEDVSSMIVKAGFVIKEEGEGVECGYTRDDRSMMRSSFNVIWFCAVKEKIVA